MAFAENNNYSVLLVEDDEVDIQNVQREFNKLKVPIKVIIAKDGVEALQLLQEQDPEKAIKRPELIILDINMPRMNGIEFLQKLRADENFKYMKVFILTTAYTTQDKVATQGLHVSGYIVKPLSSDDIMTIYWAIIGPTP